MKPTPPASQPMMSQLALIEKECQPTDFFGLFAIADQICKTTSLYPEIESSAWRSVLGKLVRVSSAYDACVNESTLKGLLNDIDRCPGDATEFKEIRKLVQGLHTVNLRAEFLHLLVHSSVASAARMLLAINSGASHADSFLAWQSLLESTRFYPALAHLAIGCDVATLRNFCMEQHRLVIQSFRTHGFEPILPGKALLTAEYDAWGAWIQAAQTRTEERLPLLSTASHTLSLALNFVLLTERTVQASGRGFDSLYEGASMTAIVRELMSKKLAKLPEDVYDKLLNRQKGESKSALQHDPYSAGNLFFFSEGIIRKRHYLVDLPHINNLCEHVTYTDYQKWVGDRIAFVRARVDNIPRSLHAKQLRIEHDTMQAKLLDASLTSAGEKVPIKAGRAPKDMTPEAIATIVGEATGLPPIVTPVLTFFFCRLFRLLGKNSAAEQ